MKPRRPQDDRKRLILTFELAIVLPAAALVIAGVLHLRTIQRDRNIEAAFQRDFTQTLAISEKHINQKAREEITDLRSQLPAPDKLCTAVLDKLLAANPHFAHMFIHVPGKPLLVRSQPHRLSELGFRYEADDFVKTIEAWGPMEFESITEKLARMKEPGSSYHFFVNWAPRGEKHMLYQSVGAFLVQNKESGNKVMVGAAFDADYLRDEFFPQMLEDLTSRNLPEGQQNDKNHPVLMIHPRYESAPLAVSSGWDGGEPEVERNLESVFPYLTLAIKLRGTTLQAIGQRFMRTSFLTLAALSILLAGGIYLTHRNVSKEVALARLKSDFVSNVSHELRTPLSLIRLYAETLELGRVASQEKYQEYYQIIRKESERLTALINNILDFSRIEAGRKEYDFRETDMQELVRNTLESYRYQIEQNGFTFEEKIEDQIPPLRVDRESIARSLLNLVNNALKYSQDRKYIGVNLYRQNAAVKLEVVDHGIGIPQEEQQKIFDKFYRVGDPLVHNTKGSGLGLSIVRHVVRAHGGEVAVDSEPGRGSRFIITLPLTPDPKPATA